MKADIRAAFGWAWSVYRSNLSAFLALSVVVVVIQFFQQLALAPLVSVLTDCSSPKSPGQQESCDRAMESMPLTFTVLLVLIVVGLIATIGVQRAALHASLGVAPRFSTLFATLNLGRYLLLMLVYSIVVGIGLALCLLPGIALMFALQLSPYYVLDRGTGPIEAFRKSWSAIKAQPSAGVTLLLIYLAASLLGGTFYGVATLITLPLATLFTVHVFRQLNGEAVASPN